MTSPSLSTMHLRVKGGIFALVAGGCGGGERQPAVTDSGNDLIQVSASADPAWQENGAWRLKLERVIGADPERDGVEFRFLIALALDSAQRLYAAENDRLWVFDSLGRKLGTFGRRGAGPGEYRFLAGVQVLPDSKLLLVDLSLERYTVIDTAGTVLRSAPRSLSPFFVQWPGAVRADGRIVDYSLSFDVDPRRLQLITHDSAFATESVTDFAVPAERPNYFGPDLTLDITSGGVVLGLPISNEYVTFSTAGDTLRHVKWLAPLPRSTAAERNDAETASRDRMGSTAAATGKTGAHAPSLMQASDTKPGFRRALLDPSGHVWLERIPPDGAFAVFDPVGTYLGEVKFPSSISPSARPLILPHRIILAAEDSTGRPVVQYWRLDRTP